MAKECQFTDVVHKLGEYYPEKKMKDISVAFCFICLLHLANENELEIKMDRSEGSQMDNLVIVK
jgi:condensin complex subunit 2